MKFGLVNLYQFVFETELEIDRIRKI